MNRCRPGSRYCVHRLLGYSVFVQPIMGSEGIQRVRERYTISGKICLFCNRRWGPKRGYESLRGWVALPDIHHHIITRNNRIPSLERDRWGGGYQYNGERGTAINSKEIGGRTTGRSSRPFLHACMQKKPPPSCLRANRMLRKWRAAQPQRRETALEHWARIQFICCSDHIPRDPPFESIANHLSETYRKRAMTCFLKHQSLGAMDRVSRGKYVAMSGCRHSTDEPPSIINLPEPC